MTIEPTTLNYLNEKIREITADMQIGESKDLGNGVILRLVNYTSDEYPIFEVIYKNVSNVKVKYTENNGSILESAYNQIMGYLLRS